MAKQVVSKAPLRFGKVDEASFYQPGIRLSYIFNEKASRAEKAGKIRSWNRFIPMTPATAAEILSRDLPPETVIVFELHADGHGEIQFNLGGKFNQEADFDIPEKSLDAGIIRVDGKNMGQGIGRTIFRNQIEFFRACGVKRFDILAALTNGGYSWARFGFLPDDIKADDFDEDVRTPAQESAALLKPFLKEKEYSKLSRILKFRTPKDLWRAADADIDLGPRLKPVFAQAADPYAPKRKAAHAQKLVAGLQAHFSGQIFEYMKDGALAGAPVKIGRLLLTGTSWSGSVNMDDPAQMKRIGAYTGGWRHIEIK